MTRQTVTSITNVLMAMNIFEGFLIVQLDGDVLKSVQIDDVDLDSMTSAIITIRDKEVERAVTECWLFNMFENGAEAAILLFERSAAAVRYWELMAEHHAPVH